MFWLSMVKKANHYSLLGMVLWSASTTYLQAQSTIYCLALTIESTSEVIDSQLDIIESLVDTLLPSGGSYVCNLATTESLIDRMLLCASTSITAAPTVINVGGPYCLENNITTTGGPAISIFADGVFLNLNSFDINQQGTTSSDIGILVNGNRRAVVIKNGTITGPATSDGFAIDLLSSCSQVAITDVAIIGGGTGIRMTDANEVALSGVSIRDNGGTSSSGVWIRGNSSMIGLDYVTSESAGNVGFLVDGTSSLLVQPVITNSTATRATNEGMRFVAASQAIVDNCLTTSNLSHGMSFATIAGATVSNCLSAMNAGDGLRASACDTINIINSEFNDSYGANTNGCHILGGGLAVIQVCSADHNNGAGFKVDLSTTTTALLEDCDALNNISASGHGFHVEGYPVTINRCHAYNNAGVGFTRDASTVVNQYYRCTACNNAGGNYSVGPISAAITSSANIRGVANSDCSLSTLDQIEVTLSLVDVIQSETDVIESVLDRLIEIYG